MDFTFDAEQLALRDVARQALEQPVDGDDAARAGRRPDRVHRRPVAAAGRARLDRPAGSRGPGRGGRRPAGDVHRAGADGAHPAARAVLLLGRAGHAGRPGAGRRRPVGRPGRRGAPGHGGPGRDRPRRPAGHGAGPGPAQGRRLGGERPQAAGAGRAHRGLGDRGGPERGGRAVLPARPDRWAGHRRRRRSVSVEAVPTLDPTRKAARAGHGGGRGRAARARGATRRRSGAGCWTTCRWESPRSWSG